MEIEGHEALTHVPQTEDGALRAPPVAAGGATPPEGVGSIASMPDKRDADIIMMTNDSDDKAANAKDSNDNHDNGGLTNGRKRKCRRKQKGGKHHRKWKPYAQLTWDEKKVMDERETRRACQKRDMRFASGQPMAPYNTTQFLMEQHEPTDAALQHMQREGHASRYSQDSDRVAEGVGSGAGGGLSSGSGHSTDDYDSPDEEEIFLERDFTEAYENFQAERLQQMTKEELVREHLELEAKVEKLEKQLKEGEPRHQGDHRRSSGGGSSIGAAAACIAQQPGVTPLATEEACIDPVEMTKIEQEIQALREENKRLKTENEAFKCIAKEGDNL